MNSKNKISAAILIIILLCILFLLTLSYSAKIVFNNTSIDLDDVVFPSMNIDVTMTPNWYFFHNDKLYVYDNNGDNLYSTDLYANNKSIISSSEDLRYANILIVYNEEMFYYTEYNRGIKKINLRTGKITNVIDDKYLYLIPDTLKDGKVLVNYLNNYSGKSHAYFATLDLKTGLLSNEKKVNYATNQPYFYNTENNKIYYLDSYDNKNNIYEDNKIIYSYESDTNLSSWQTNINSNVLDLVFVQDNYLFAIICNKIIKFDLSDYSIIEEKELDNSFSLISSVREGGSRTLGIEEGPAATSLYPLFSVVNRTDSDSQKSGIYKFNSTTLSFEKIIDKNTGNGFVQKYNNYFILQTDTQTIIYDTLNNKYKVFNSANYSVENDCIYLMTYKGDFYHQSSSYLEFKIKKLLLKDIF